MPYDHGIIKRKRVIASPESYFTYYDATEPSFEYITEDASQVYTAEDGITYYVWKQ